MSYPMRVPVVSSVRSIMSVTLSMSVESIWRLEKKRNTAFTASSCVGRSPSGTV